MILFSLRRGKNQKVTSARPHTIHLPPCSAGAFLPFPGRNYSHSWLRQFLRCFPSDSVPLSHITMCPFFYISLSTYQYAISPIRKNVWTSCLMGLFTSRAKNASALLTILQSHFPPAYQRPASPHIHELLLSRSQAVTPVWFSDQIPDCICLDHSDFDPALLFFLIYLLQLVLGVLHPLEPLWRLLRIASN